MNNITDFRVHLEGEIAELEKSLAGLSNVVAASPFELSNDYFRGYKNNQNRYMSSYLETLKDYLRAVERY